MDKSGEALNKFKEQYPSVTSGELQAFALGYKAKEEEVKNPFEEIPEGSFILQRLRLKQGVMPSDLIAYLESKGLKVSNIEKDNNGETKFTVKLG